MHELPITRSLLDLALRHAEEAGGGRITDLHLEVGRLSGVIGKFVQFYWNIVSEGTPAEGALLHFEHVELEMECLGCGTLFNPDGSDYACTACASNDVQVVNGEQFHLVSIDLDQDDPTRSEGY
ncbi:hydrogenase maturation nickel metallochaperone HypA [Gemmatimonadota bacterium]